MCDTVGDEKFSSLQGRFQQFLRKKQVKIFFEPFKSKFELIRASGDFILCPTVGFLADKSMAYWNKKNGARDVQKTFVPYTMIFVANIVFIVGLLNIDNFGIWPYLIGLTLCMGQIYMFETIGCSINFPATAQGRV